MSSIVTIAFLLFFVFTPMESTPIQTNFERTSLSEMGQKAYENLLHATQFEDARVGYAGVISTYAQNLETLLNEQNGDAAFKSLLENGTTAAKLYALCGLFYTDHSRFKSEIETFRKSRETVTRVSGCEIFDESVSKIIESGSPNVAIIGPGESLDQYLAGNAGRSYNIDIANGGYQATFRHFVKQEIESTK